MKPRKPLRRKSKDSVSKAKDRIQALLRELRLRIDGDCIARGIDRVCSGPLQFDHIESRSKATTYAMVMNGVILCQGHHFYWKRQYPNRWADLVRDYIGQEAWEHIHKISREIKNYQLKDWLNIEEKLKAELKELGAEQ